MLFKLLHGFQLKKGLTPRRVNPKGAFHIMKNLDRVLTALEIVVRVSLFAALVPCIGMAIIINAQIAGRFIGVSTLGTVEISEYMLGGLAFLGLAYAQLSGTHVRVVSIVSRFPPRLQTIIDYFTFTLLLCLGVLISCYAAKLAYIDWQSGRLHFGEAPLPIWITSFLAFVGYFCLTITFLIQLGRKFVDRQKG